MTVTMEVELAGSWIRQIRQEAGTIALDLDGTSDGALTLVFAGAVIAHQTLDVSAFALLPVWHPQRLVAWADVVAEYICIAVATGGSLFIRAEALRSERSV